MQQKVKFTAIKDGDKADYDLLHPLEVEYASGTANRLLNALVSLDESLSGYQITRLGHSLQSATRAHRDGADIDWVWIIVHKVVTTYNFTLWPVWHFRLCRNRCLVICNFARAT